MLPKDYTKMILSAFEYVAAKDNILTFKCDDCNKDYEKEFDENSTNWFESKYKFCDDGINKFCLMLKKVVYPY